MHYLNRYWTGLVIILAISCVLQMQPDWHQQLTFHSKTVMSQGWPLITTHFIHLNWTHALFNLAGLALIVIIWREYWNTRWLVNALLLSAAATSLLLWLLPFTIIFVGLSGVLHGLLGYCLIKDIKAGKKWMWLILVALISKVVIELFGWQPDHFVGQQVSYIHAAGLFTALLLYKLERRRLSDAVPDKE